MQAVVVNSQVGIFVTKDTLLFEYNEASQPTEYFHRAEAIL